MQFKDTEITQKETNKDNLQRRLVALINGVTTEEGRQLNGPDDPPNSLQKDETFWLYERRHSNAEHTPTLIKGQHSQKQFNGINDRSNQCIRLTKDVPDHNR